MATDFMNKTSARILPDLSKPTYEQLLARVQELETRPARKVWFKVTEKGGISAYGLGQFPVTLYKSQWEQLMASLDELPAFITLNVARLTSKPTKG